MQERNQLAQAANRDIARFTGISAVQARVTLQAPKQLTKVLTRARKCGIVSLNDVPERQKAGAWSPVRDRPGLFDVF